MQHPYREIVVPDAGAGMRLDRFLALRFRDRSRSWLSKGIRAGEVRDDADRPLRPSARLKAGQVLRLYLEGIAPTGARPPLPPVLYRDDRLVVFDKPPGLLAHPVGTRFAWGLINLAREAWPDEALHLVHRLDRDTSGCIVLARDADAARHLKEAIRRGELHKEYEALCVGEIPWEEARLEGPIGPAGGIVRIQMAVRPDGLPARTDVRVLRRRPGATWVRCRLHTGRTHQIRVHLHHAGHPLLGDRLYGPPAEVFLRSLEIGNDHPEIVESAGAPRHALHASRVILPHPQGGTVDVVAPPPADLLRWWEHPEVLPHDYEASAQPTAQISA